ncbi:type I-E CRISPR-associated protein Cse2/CasB [Methylobacterium fujisawaense]|jgi:CRISPR system Cascade subunit CasB
MEDIEKPAEPKSVGAVASSWWHSLQPVDAAGNKRPGVDRGILARLRRAATIQELALERSTVELCRQLMDAGRMHRSVELALPRAALIAGVLSNVTSDLRQSEGAESEDRVRTAALLAWDEDRRRAVLSEDRFRNLLAVESGADTLRAFRMVVGLANRPLPVADLAASLADWTDPVRGQERRRRWAFDYYGGRKTAAA